MLGFLHKASINDHFHPTSQEIDTTMSGGVASFRKNCQHTKMQNCCMVGASIVNMDTRNDRSLQRTISKVG